MTHPEDDKATLAALRAAPTEVSLEQVRSMVAAFPLAVGAMAWIISTLKFNLNTILMTSSATLIVGASAYLLSTTAPAELPATAAEAMVVMEMPASAPEPEPAVVFEMPTPKKGSTSGPKEDERTANNDQPELACSPRLSAQHPGDSAAVPPTPEEEVLAYTGVQPLPSTELPAPMVHKATGERTYQVRDFTGIKVVSNMDVTLDIGDFAVTATGEEDALEQLDVQVNGGVLELDFRIIGRSRRTCSPVQFTVHMPLVHALTVMGSGSINGSELPSTTKLDLSVTGSGNIILARLLDATNLNILVRGSGAIQLKEVVRTERAELNVTGSGLAQVGRISKASDLQILVAGSGIADCKQVAVSGTTTLNLTGSGQVNATGRTERIEVSVFGSGDVMAKELKAQGGKVIVTGSGDASVYSDGPLELLTTGSGTIHTSGSAGLDRSRGVGNDGR